MGARTLGREVRTRISGGMLIDGTGAAPVEGATVLIDDGRIAAVGRNEDFGTLEGAVEDVDATGKWILPGLINMHEHLIFRNVVGDPFAAMAKDPVEQTLIGVANALDGLRRGWTTVRDMGTRHGIAQKIRHFIGQGAMPGPRILTTGSPISVTGGHASILCVQADGADAARLAARQQLAEGADVIKIMASHDPFQMPGAEQTRPEMNLDEMKAAFQEARHWGKRTACHVMGTTAISRVLDAGVDVLDHGVYLDEELAERMAHHGTYFCPTLSAYDRQTMNPAFERGRDWAEMHSVLVEPHERSFRLAVAAGVQIVAGTDSVGSYSEELELMRAGGLSAMKTILACTRTAAEALALEHEIGAVMPGLAADLVILEADPLLDPLAVDRVSQVVKDGRISRPEEITL